MRGDGLSDPSSTLPAAAAGASPAGMPIARWHSTWRGARAFILLAACSPQDAGFESKYPAAEDLVVVQVKNVAEMGAYVSLLEYNGIEVCINACKQTNNKQTNKQTKKQTNRQAY